jgi:benzoylformate decarboxylase
VGAAVDRGQAWDIGTAAVGSIRLGLQDLLALAAPVPRSLPAARAKAARVQGAADQRISTALLMQTVADLREPANVIVEEAPSARPTIQAHLPILHSETFYTMCSGGLGYGMPAAVGIALAHPERKVIAIIGDGSSMYSIQALWSAARQQLPISFIIVKNRRYAALQDFAPTFGYTRGAEVAGTDLPDLDFVALAQGQGCAAERVEDALVLEAVLARALSAPGPVLVEVEVD